MDLHGIVSGAIGAVNPPVAGVLARCTGYSTGADGKVAPAYAAGVAVSVQRQELSYKDLQHVDGLNIQGILCAVYLPGIVQGANRADGTGGDLLTFPDAGGTSRTWRVASVTEQWSNWCKAILVQQVPA
jgi:hypothetical protein